MKKLILSLTAVVALALGANAQTEKGKWILGGTASYESNKTDAAGAKAVEFLAIMPNAGYFVSNNLALGTGVGYQLTKGSTSRTESITVSPFARYYAGLSDQFKFFGQASVPLAFGTVKAVDASGDVGAKTGSSTSVGVALSPGFAYFPTKKIGIEFALNGISYTDTSVEDAGGNDIAGAGSERFSIGTNFFQPRIGIQFHF